MDENEKRIAMIRKDGLKARGKEELITHLQGGRLTHRQAIQAHCYDCMGYFADGRADCEMPRCPLYPFMNFNRNKNKRVKRVLTGEHLRKMIRAKQESHAVKMK